jgi:hypothetical protein
LQERKINIEEGEKGVREKKELNIAAKFFFIGNFSAAENY